jgi:hypothetical protein
LFGEDHGAQPEDVGKPEVDETLGRFVVSSGATGFLPEMKKWMVKFLSLVVPQQHVL